MGTFYVEVSPLFPFKNWYYYNDALAFTNCLESSENQIKTIYSLEFPWYCMFLYYYFKNHLFSYGFSTNW